MRHGLQTHAVLAFAFAFAFAPRASADPPAAAGDQPVRQVGGAHGSKVDKVEADHAHTALPNAASAQEAMRAAREQARGAMKEAREAVQKAPEETRAAVQEARSAMKEAQHDVRTAIEKAPEETRAAVQEAREAVQKARDQGREAIKQAKDAMQKARDQVEGALPGAGQESRKQRARYARRVAWHGLMNRVQSPSAIAPVVRQELRHHAGRVAKLQRIRALAAEQHDDPVMQRCDKLLAREQKRHQDKLEHMLPSRAQAAPAADSEDEDPAEAERAEDEEQPEGEQP